MDTFTSRLVQRPARLPVLLAIALLWIIAVMGQRFGAASHFFIIAYLLYRVLMELVDNPKDGGHSSIAHMVALLWVLVVLIIAARALLLITTGA